MLVFVGRTTACADGDGATDAIRGRLSKLPSRFDYFLDEVRKVPNGRSRFWHDGLPSVLQGRSSPCKAVFWVRREGFELGREIAEVVSHGIVVRCRFGFVAHRSGSWRPNKLLTPAAKALLGSPPDLCQACWHATVIPPSANRSVPC